MANHVIRIPLLRIMQSVGLSYSIIITYYYVIITLVLLLPIITYFSLPNLQMHQWTQEVPLALGPLKAGPALFKTTGSWKMT